MERWNIMKRLRVSCGHRLSKHEHLCRNIHGHNLYVDVYLSSGSLNKNDMVIDFSVLKKWVECILEPFDHATLLNTKDNKTIYTLKALDYKILTPVYDCDPTAEVLCKYVYQDIKSKLVSKSEYFGIEVKKVGIWENEFSYAEYEEEV